MTRVRLVLVLLMLVFGDLFYTSISIVHPENDMTRTIIARLILGLLAGLPLFWSVFMFVALLFKAKKDPDGEICLAPGHPLLKLSNIANKFYGGYALKNEFKPCPLYWKISLLSALCFLAIMCAIFIFYILFIAPFFGNFFGLMVLAIGLMLAGISHIINSLHYRLRHATWSYVKAVATLFYVGIICWVVIMAMEGIWNFIYALTCGILAASILAFIGILTVMAADFLNSRFPRQMNASVEYLESAIDHLDKIPVAKIKARWCPPVRECTENDFK